MSWVLTCGITASGGMVREIHLVPSCHSNGVHGPLGIAFLLLANSRRDGCGGAGSFSSNATSTSVSNCHCGPVSRVLVTVNAGLVLVGMGWAHSSLARPVSFVLCRGLLVGGEYGRSAALGGDAALGCRTGGAALLLGCLSSLRVCSGVAVDVWVVARGGGGGTFASSLELSSIAIGLVALLRFCVGWASLSVPLMVMPAAVVVCLLCRRRLRVMGSAAFGAV